MDPSFLIWSYGGDALGFKLGETVDNCALWPNPDFGLGCLPEV